MAIEVHMWGQKVGVVDADPRSRTYAFEYYPEWKRQGIDVAPLTMPVNSARSIWSFSDLGEGFHGLPGLLADALPDAFGNRLIDAWMAAHGVTAEAVTMLDRLAYMAKRGMGALEFHPSRGSKTESAKPLEMSGLVDEARRVIEGSVATADAATAALKDIIRVGTSAGGARAKAVIAWNPSRNEIRSGQFDVPEGFEHWLLKFDNIGADYDLGTPRGYGRIEFAYSLMAAAAGIEMSPCRLLEENGRAHFMTRRFDREGNQKHHIQSLCALAHLDYKITKTHSYEQLFLAIAQLGLGDGAQIQAFRRMAFNFMARNCDDHTKNFAFRLRKGASWEFAPAYDLTHSYRPGSPWVSEHQMSVNGKFADVSRDDLLALASRFAVPHAARTVDEVAAAVGNWGQSAEKAGMTPSAGLQIAADFQIV